VSIRQVSKKIEQGPGKPQLVRTVPGIGSVVVP
jgi:hypothetical protein